MTGRPRQWTPFQRSHPRSSPAGPARAASSRAGPSRGSTSNSSPNLGSSEGSRFSRSAVHSSSSRAQSFSSNVRSSAATPLAGSRAGSRSSSIYSPQLPLHDRRPRLSLRPPPTRTSSVTDDHAGLYNPDLEDDDDDVAEDADALNEIIMAIDMKKDGNLGCAYYIAADETLLLLEDVPMAGIEIVQTLLLYAKPTTVLTPARTSESLMDLLTRGAQGRESHGAEDEPRGAYILRTMKTADFRFDSARDKLVGLPIQTHGEQTMVYNSVAEEAPDYGEDHIGQQGSIQGCLMRLGASVNLESRLTIGCAGAVLGDMQRRRAVQYLPGDPDASVAFRIRSVQMFSLFDSMFVNADTLASLQILQSEFHPNSQMRGPDKSSSGAKENLSVYGLFKSFACTPQGKAKLRRIFMRPSIDIDLIRSRHKTIAYLSRPEHTEALAGLASDLRKTKNMLGPVANLRKGVDNPGPKFSIENNVWRALQRFARHVLSIWDTLGQLPGAGQVPVIRSVQAVIQPAVFHRLGEMITQTVDLQQSGERGRTAVKHGLDAQLDEMKRTYDGMEHFLTHVIEKLRGDVPEWAQRYIINCVFMPQLGFLTVVSLNPATGKGNFEGEGADDGWEEMFVAQGLVYCKNRKMREMDKECGDGYCMIIDRETEIVHELTVRVLEDEEAILAASDVLGELDSILALAFGATRYNWVAPEMTQENVLHIEGGRHPLQELVTPSFIANDCNMCGGAGSGEEGPDEGSCEAGSGKYASTVILTGPNHSGKSVYLKQVALIVYLAHIGCFVPADRALVGITDRILTRVATRESVARTESAFAIDLRQAAFAINFASRRSLVLVDEFGKGTNSMDGAGLVTGLLDHFDSLGTERPKVLAATHFHEIFECDFLIESGNLTFAHMDVRVDFEAAEADDQVTHLYKLVPGRSTSSFGSRCAAMNGVDAAVVERAEALMLLLVRGEDLEMACSTVSAAETRKLADAEAVVRAFVKADIIPPDKASARSSSKSGWDFRLILEQVLAVPVTSPSPSAA